MICVGNICIISKENCYLSFGNKLEALAAIDCENPVETKKGIGYLRNCYNSDGSIYMNHCCESDENYKDTCQGRACGNFPKF